MSRRPQYSLFSQGVRQHPLSPPDTDSTVADTSSQTGYPHDPKYRAFSSLSEFGPSIAHRRMPSSVFYKSNDSLRENPPPRKLHRWVVVVIPPAALVEGDMDDAPLSHAVMLPLFPTMYAQLAAIAREYNLPSVAGLRLFLHLTEPSGHARITEEVWPLLWNHQFAPSQDRSHPSLPPISGRIEFDIDMRAAKWFPAWGRSQTHSPQEPVPKAMPPAGGEVHDEAETVYSGRAESLVSLYLNDPKVSNIRRLSLLERRPAAAGIEGLHPLVMGSSHPSIVTRRPAESHPETLVRPVTEAEEEPDVVAHDPREGVESMIEKWRSKTPVLSSMTVPVPPPIEAHRTVTNSPHSTIGITDLDLNDFTWSISSAGPLSCDQLDPLSISTGVYSMDLGNRAAGSVILTPSTATSWGPPLDDEAFNYGVGIDMVIGAHESSLGRTSPDIADRVLEYAPLTPSTATSWGPPDDDFDYHAEEMMMSEGARTPDIGERALSPTVSMSLLPAFKAEAFVYQHAWPYTGDVGLVHVPTGIHLQCLDLVAYPLVHSTSSDISCVNVKLDYVYPNISIFAPVYPYNLESIYPPISVSTSSTCATVPIPIPPLYPNVVIFKTADPHNLENIRPSIAESPASRPRSASLSILLVSIQLPRLYPDVVIYAPVYPHNLLSIYPVVAPQDDAVPLVTVGPPNSMVYVPTYPCDRAELQERRDSTSPTIHLARSYHDLVVDTPVYPYNLLSIYPAVSKKREDAASSINIHLPRSYPDLVVYTPVYPHNLRNIYPTIERRSTQADAVQRSPAIVRSKSAYPDLVFYDAVYPFSAECLYPLVPVGSRTSSSFVLSTLNIDPPMEYPTMEIYPPVYPFNLKSIYPRASSVASEARSVGLLGNLGVEIEAVYPLISLYPAVYPHFEIYPVLRPVARSSEPREATSVHLQSNCPTPSIYRAMYPDFDLCPKVVAELVNTQSTPTPILSLTVQLPSRYPYLHLYEDVYPSLVMYPPLVGELASRNNNEVENPRHVEVEMNSQYPSLQIYKPEDLLVEFHPMTLDATENLELMPHPLYLTPNSSSFYSERGSLCHDDSLSNTPDCCESSEAASENSEVRRLREAGLASCFSFTDDQEFDILDNEMNSPFAMSMRLSNRLSLTDLLNADVEVHQFLQDLDSPSRRFYLARQRDLRVSPVFSDREESVSEEVCDEDVAGVEFEHVPISMGPPPVPSRPNLPFSIASSSSLFSERPTPSSLNVPMDVSGFYDDDDDDNDDKVYDVDTNDELYGAHQQSRLTRFPRPTLSDVAEESSPYSAQAPDAFPTSATRPTTSGPHPRGFQERSGQTPISPSME